MNQEARQWVQSALAISLGLTMFAILLWDVIAINVDRGSETVSQLMRYWSREYPELLLPIGYLICHLFGR